MKKIFLLAMILFTSCAFAADKLHVEALSDFSSENIEQSANISFKLIEDGTMNGTFMIKGDILNCVLKKITDPTRAKRDAKIYFSVVSYQDSKGVHNVPEPLVARYAKTVLNKEEIKKTPPKKIVKTAAGAVGNFFMKGFSYCVSFADGFATNPEGNRLKSGAKQVYKDSFLSMVEYGSEVSVNKGDTFYLVVKSAKDRDVDENLEEIQKEENESEIIEESKIETKEELSKEDSKEADFSSAEENDEIEVVREIKE